MRQAFGLLAVVIAVAIGLYVYSQNAQTIAESSPGETLESAPLLTGVKNDLLSIANAERGYMAEQGKYASSVDDLVSGHYLSTNPTRAPYLYDLESSGTTFRVTATRSGPGAPAQLWIDESMQIHSSN